MASFNQPLSFEPIYQERVWGGRRLESELGRILPRGQIGESWEIVDRPEAQSIVRRGPFKGKTLHELWNDHREQVFGANLVSTPRFPLLAKLLDAREKLSLQVHPDADAAHRLGGESKTEMWHFLAADRGAEIFAGFRRGVDRVAVTQGLQGGNVAQLIHRMEVHPGDTFLVPSGRLHAIGAGNLLIEIQENSDTTYRVFDWNRQGSNGQPRELHLEEAMRSIQFDDYEPQIVGPKEGLLCGCAHFSLERWQLTASRSTSGFAVFVCVSGRLMISGDRFGRGDFFLLPAGAKNIELEPQENGTSVLRVTIPAQNS